MFHLCIIILIHAFICHGMHNQNPVSAPEISEMPVSNSNQFPFSLETLQDDAKKITQLKNLLNKINWDLSLLEIGKTFCDCII